MEEFIKDLKVTQFDVIAKHEAKISVLEQAIVQETNSNKEEILRTLWAKYNNLIKTLVNTTDVLSESLRGLAVCEEEYANVFNQLEKQDAIEKDPITKIEVVTDENEEEKQEEITSEVPADEPVEEVVEEKQEEVTSEVSTDEPVEEVVEEKQEEVTSEVSTDEPVEEVVEEKQEEVTLEVPTSEPVEEVVEEKQEEVTSEVSTSEPVEEVVEEKQEEVTLEVPTSEPVEEVVEEKKEEGNPTIPEPLAEESPIVEIPLEETMQTPAEENKPTEEETQAAAILQLPTMEEGPSIPEKLDTETVATNKTIYIKNYEKEDRAILINQSQAMKLRGSRETQKALYQSKNSSVTEQQLEEMLGQVTALYEEGKTQEAEALSNQINELSKTLKKTA